MSLSHPPPVRLQILESAYAVVRLAPDAPIPERLTGATSPSGFVSITRTHQELSIVCPVSDAPPELENDGPWRGWYAAGPIPFGLTGVVASLVDPLAAEGCPVFVVSTFDGDLLLVPEADAERATSLLEAAGHHVVTGSTKR